ncbi:MAG: aminotransferase class I/II-fold pyridoxal phosphate-dependent enzyme [Rhodothermaceae bacterium]|nr:aminotransferase class I/II-fold pyridoxal phosphate-dependent enzyme [Rhodothermaceae bacterium]MXW33279.1 aminotransferase class I/II-fold pyridoxal phosphate-dependent enzyme [Rhodothermaceae bacterium]MXZ16965.1 aminotransferase class I/II-fold pyridoxal phosphate-dependent enzyme [Rhodothermaceae bacterium]MYC04944.1 aminotransferase class I/II-fold pyridoxal phosphate-dependent enzyme [Rhodothermaceae bacterium]MYE62295.1 aminotransferase class I/II-fold pyridoxal phosphate-dependent e
MINPNDTLPAEPTIFEKTRAFMAPGALINEVKDAGLYPYFRAISRSEGTRAFIDGRELIMAGSNNYLGLTSDPRVKAAANEAIARYGTGCTGSRFLNGTLDIHLELEARLAAFMQKEACVLFSTGYMTNMGVIQGITSKNDLIFSDKDNHACIVAGTQVSTANCWRYRHFDMNHLRRLLEKAEAEQPEADKLIVTDGVFSMSGRIAPVPELVKLADEFGAALMLDDAHAVGVIGPGGKGSAAYFGLGNEVPLTTGTFSKSFSSLGGFVTGDNDVIEYIRHTARAHIFSASMPPSMVATVLKCLDILQEETWRLDRLWQISDYMREGFRSAGFDVWTSEAPIIPVVIGNDMMTAFQFWTDLLEEGVFVNPVIPWRGAVPRGLNIMRTSYMATHTDEDLDRILEAFYRVGQKHGVLDNHAI